MRRFAAGDAPVLLAVFQSVVHPTAARDYRPEQLVGYADLQPNGCIDHFFVSGQHPRHGTGALLMDRIQQEAQALGLAQLTADVSLTAQPFFAHYGFDLVARRAVVRGGVTLPNALVRKPF